ncbi:MAG: hypothetical protein ACPGXI_16705 [Mycobacterium sp.]
MEGNGVDIATLGLRVDARPVKDAHAALDDFTKAGQRAETQTKSLGLTQAEVARLNAKTMREIVQAEERHQAEKAAREKLSARTSAQTAEETARAQIAAMEKAFREEAAFVKLAVANGFIKPAEAEKLGREAASRFNRGLAQSVGTARDAGGFRGSALVGVTDQIKNVGAEGRKAGLGLGRLNDAFVTVARQATGTSPVVGKLADTIGTFAIGTAYMVPVLAGIAAIGFAWQKITEDAREARKAQDEAITSALRAAQIRDLGAAGTAAEELEASVAAETRIRARLSELREQLARAQRSGNQNRVDSTGARIRATVDELRDAETASAELREQVFENVSRENDRLQSERDRANTRSARSADEAVRIEERKRAAFERLAQETQRREAQSTTTLRNLEQQAAAERRLSAAQAQGAEAVAEVNRELAREEALRQALANAVPRDIAAIVAQVNAIHDLRDANAEMADVRERTAKEFADTLKGLVDAQGKAADEERARAEAAAEASRRWRDAWVSAAYDVAAAFGQSASNAAAFSANAVDAIRLHASDRGAGASAALGSIGGFAGTAIGTILDSRRDRAEVIKAATEEFDRVLDDYVATLADRSRFDQLVADAEAGAQGVLDSMVEALLADLGTRGDFGKEAAQKIRDGIAKGLDAQGLEGILSQFGPEGQAILDAYREKLQQIADQRQKEIDTATDSLRVRELIAQGRTEEAAALERDLANRKAIKEALELGGKALAEYTRSVQEQEEAARKAAEAERAATEARDRARQAVQDRFDVDAREAALAGDDRGAFGAGLAGRAAAEKAALDDRLAAGEIEIELYNRLYDVIDGEVVKALRDFDQAAADAAERVKALAEAERFRAAQDLRNLEVELLLEQGRDDTAFSLQQEIRLRQALNDGKSDEYIATLRQLQAQQASNRAAEKAAEAAREQARATEEFTRAADGALRVIGGPHGLTQSIGGYRNQALRYGGTPFDVSSPDFTGSGSTSNRYEISIQTQPGQDNVAIGQALAEQIRREVARIEALGGFVNFGGI